MIKDLKPGTDVKLEKLSKDSHETKPPARFSEVKLIAALTEKDISRPSTASPIVSLIQDRGYVAKKGTQLYPTPMGFAAARLLNAKFPDFTDYDYTAAMETELDKISEGKQDRVKFLKNFWNGKDGFDQVVDRLASDIDFKELEQYSTIDLYNGYSIKFSKFGTFLQDDNAPLDEKGYRPSVRVDDDIDVFDYREADYCKEVFETNKNRKGPRVLGILESGEYAGWTVFVREGKFGSYLSAVDPKVLKAQEEGKKPAASLPNPVNHALLEGEDVDSVTLEGVKARFAEVKLPRHLSPTLFVGIGKRGGYIGTKASAKAKRAVFLSLPDDYDPRTVTLETVEAIIAEKNSVKKDKEVKKAAPKKTSTAGRKTPAKKTSSAKKSPAKK